MANNYDNSAWFYDRLSRLIYGRAIIKAQVYLLDHIPAGANILIVGGGTGWILEEITKKHPSGLEITYVEISARMMARSCDRNIGNNQVDFINDAIENITLQTNYDVVITPFLFDNFSEQTMQKVFVYLHNSLNPGGIWLNADFHLTGHLWQKNITQNNAAVFQNDLWHRIFKPAGY